MIKAICFDAFGTICSVSMGGISMFKETSHVLSSLKEQGYKIGIISNISRIFADFLLKELPFEPDVFSAPYLSGDSKPHEAAFLYAAKGLGLEPHEILMIGDSYNNDYLGAKKVGMQALYIDTRGENRTIESITNISEVINHDYLI